MRTTSSSISSSETVVADAAGAWRRFVLAFAAAASLVFLSLVAFVVAVDPYQTGRLALLKARGVPAQAPRTAHASRGRDPAYDAAIIGNSHIQLLSPAELTRQTGIPFVSLAVPGTGPREALVLLDYFLRHRVRPARALVLGIDPYWCRADPEMPILFPFPFWLYERGIWRYLVGIVRHQSLEDAVRRLVPEGRRSRWAGVGRDGFWDYDEGFVWQPERYGPMFRAAGHSGILNETGRFPAIEALGRALDAAPANLPVVLVLPPVYAATLPQPGSALAESEAACRSALVETIRGRPSVALVDWRVDRPELRVPENFTDPTHYRSPIAREVERDVAASLAAIPGAAGRGGP